MTSYLNNAIFRLYVSGVYHGKILFEEKQVQFATVDARRRTQMQMNRFPVNSGFTLPIEKIHGQLSELADTTWSGEEVIAKTGDVYQKHIQFRAIIDGRHEESQVWARRNDTAIDVVTVDGAIIAFVCPNRYGLEVLVREGYENLTPLVVYEDESLSQPRYGVNHLGTFLIPMRDGVRLATDVYLPEFVPLNTATTTEGSDLLAIHSSVAAESGQSGHDFPTILVRTCYDRNGKKHAFMHWVNKGYAVVVQDVRGRSDSEGELVPFYYERDDGSDTIDWIASQAWSDGNVGMWGASYLGYVVVAAATSGNPHLKAVVDEVNVGSPFIDTVRRGGTVCSWPLLCWTLAQSVGTRTDFDVFAGKTVSPEEAVDIRPITEIPQKTIGKRSHPWDLWAEHPEYDSFWKNCTFSELGHQVKAPMFVISGWYDGDSAGVSETWRMLTENNVPSRKIWLGPWEHNPNRSRDLEGQHFSNDSVVYDYDVHVLKWFDRFLKGIRNGIDEEARATYYVVGENKWHTSSDWTPTEAQVWEFYLASGGRANSRHGDGILSTHSTLHSAAQYDQFVYDPSHPFTDSGERSPDNLDQHELRNDILVYTSAPLSDPLIVGGELSAEIYAASSGVDTDWVVTLADVDEQGHSIQLSSYIVRAKYRKGFDKPELLTPGQVEQYNIFLPNIGHTFQAGHRIRFTITSSCKMVAFPNTNTGVNPYLDPDPIVATQTIYHTSEYPSHVKLPVMPS